MRFALLLLLAFSTLANADAYKCKGANGKAVITATPCEAGYTSVGAVRSDETSADNYNQAQADLQRQKAWLVERDKVNRHDAAIAQQQADAVARAYPQVPQPQRSESIWDKPWGCMWHSCSSTKTTIR